MVIGFRSLSKLNRKIGGTLALFLLITLVEVHAQLPTATILGVVKDSTGAVVPGAKLTARNSDTGQTRNMVSGGDGSYRFPALPVGTYEVRAEESGFRAEVQSGLTLAVSQEAVVNFTLIVGAIEQTVAVTADAPMVNTTSGSLGGLVSEAKVEDLPLNGRNYVDLILLQTGIQRDPISNGGGAAMRGTWFSSNGAPGRSNNYLLDGAPMQTLAANSSASVSDTTLGIEGIREYRMVTNSFSAEYGLRMGSQMIIVSKGGTNAFHGSLFEYLRNSALDARNFFDRITPTTPGRLPPYKRNQFGASFGGPIKKDKTFFFGVYEALRERKGITTLSNTIPPEDKVDGVLVPQIAPVIKPLLTLYPDPNLPRGQFTFPFSQPINENYGQMRVDQTFSSNDTMFGRYTIDNAEQTIPGAFPQFPQGRSSRSQFATLSESHIFSATLLSTGRFSFSRTNIVETAPTDLSGPQFSFVPGKLLGSIVIGGVSNNGTSFSDPIQIKQNIFTWSDDLFYTRGRHSLKFGTLINHFQAYSEAGSFSTGQVTFANIQTFLLAQPTNYQAATPGSIQDRNYHFTTLGYYIQDDLRATNTLTFNLGLRYEFNTEYHEVNGHGAALRDIQHDATPTLGTPFVNNSLHNFSPRFGFAWDVRGDGRTAVRGGFGLLYDIANWGAVLESAAAASPPFSSLSTVVSPSTMTLPLFFPPSAIGKSVRMQNYLMGQTHMVQYNFTVEHQLPLSMAVTLAYAGSRGFNIARLTDGNPTIPQILPDGRKFWTGNESRVNPNWANINLGTADGNSYYNSFQFGLNKRLSKGLQFQSSYTWSKTIDQTQEEFVEDGTAYGADPGNRRLDQAPARFDSTHNWRFNAIYQLPEIIKSGGLASRFLNGWWTSGILSLQTGFPFSPVLQSNRSRSKANAGPAGIDRPDLVADRNNGNLVSGTTAGCQGVAPGQALGTPNLYFDPCAFAIQPIGFLGTAGRNILRGPGLANLDFSLVKDTGLQFLGENGRLQFRVEFFNILNHANFSNPNSTVYAATRDIENPLPNAGIITTTRGTSRQIQLALKLIF